MSLAPAEPAPAHDDPRAYAWAAAAILLWGTLAAATGDALRGLPAGTVLVWTLAFAAATLLAIDLATGVRPRWPTGRAVTLGVWGILGYHAAFFVALDRAPVVEANLLNYLWPLWDTRRQTWHDRLASTYVVKAEADDRERRAGASPDRTSR